jgi:hypothetical protein
MSKTAKERAKDGDMSKIDAREAKHRVAFEALGGVAGVRMRGVLWLINAWHKGPRPDLVEPFLTAIEALHLMALPEHRHGVAGAIVAIMAGLSKREAAAYRGLDEHGEPAAAQSTARAPFKPLVDSAHKLAIPVDDVLDMRPGHIDFLWTQWLVARDDQLLNRLVRLTTSHPNAEVRQEGGMLLRAHVHMTPVADRLRAVQALLIPDQARIPPNVPKAEVDELGKLLVKGAGLATILLVGWKGGEDGGFFVVTPDGEKPANCPEKWHQRPVVVRKATEQELEQHRAMISARDEP